MSNFDKKYVTIVVKFETTFSYEFDDQEALDNWDDQEAVEDIIETLGDRSNNYWRDADFEFQTTDKDGFPVEYTVDTE